MGGGVSGGTEMKDVTGKVFRLSFNGEFVGHMRFSGPVNYQTCKYCKWLVIQFRKPGGKWSGRNRIFYNKVEL